MGTGGTLVAVLSAGKEAINYFIDTNHDARGADTCFDKINNPIGEARKL